MLIDDNINWTTICVNIIEYFHFEKYCVALFCIPFGTKITVRMNCVFKMVFIHVCQNYWNIQPNTILSLFKLCITWKLSRFTPLNSGFIKRFQWAMLDQNFVCHFGTCDSVFFKLNKYRFVSTEKKSVPSSVLAKF